MQALELHNRAVGAYKSGDLSAAQTDFARAFDLGLVPAGKALISLKIMRNDFLQCFDVAHRIFKLAPLDFSFANYWLKEMAAYAHTRRPRYESLNSLDHLPPISFVSCSHLDARFQRFEQTLATTMRGRRFELIRIADAKTMSEGYARGLSLCQFEYVVLCHDDIEFVLPDFPERLHGALQNYDLVGIAGSKYLNNDSLWGAGHPYLSGQVYYPVQKTVDQPTPLAHAAVLSFDAATQNAQALDGVLLAGRRSIFEQIGFDANQPGFHYYDVDFSYRAHLLGMRVAVCNDLGILHSSRGAIGEAWHQARQWFAYKHQLPDHAANQVARHWYECEIVDNGHLLSFQQVINAFRAAP
jgi:hypothetical protein